MIVYIMSILQHMLFFVLQIEKNSFPRPLSKKEEKLCFEKIRNKDSKAMEELINHNLRLVAHIVKKYYSSLNDQDDLISIGTIGLIKAVKSYNFEKNIKFATYASRCIENEILMYFRQIKKIVNNLILSDSLSSFNSTSYFLFSSNKSMQEDDILEIVDIRNKSQILYSFINSILSEREKKVLIYRYGLYNKIPLTQQETAKRLKISRSYVSRIEKKAIQKLYLKFKKKFKN